MNIVTIDDLKKQGEMVRKLKNDGAKKEVIDEAVKKTFRNQKSFDRTWSFYLNCMKI